MVSRSFIYEFPWQFGYGAFALYLIGIAQTLADSHKAIADSWLPPPKVVDAISSTLFFGPFIIHNCMSLAAGIMAERNLGLAITFTRLLYVFWFIHCSSLGLAVLYSGVRLIRILEAHLKKFNTTSGSRYTSIKTGIFKIRTVMGIIVVCLWMFATFLLIYGILRNQIIVDKVGSIVLGAIWTYLGAVCTLGVVIAVLINPKIDENSNLGLKSSSAEKSNPTPYNYSNFTAQDYSVSTVLSSNPGGGLNTNALNELKIQQMQYQQVFQKHNNHLIPRIDQLGNKDNNNNIPLSERSSPTQQQDSIKYEYSDNKQHSTSQNTEDYPIIDDGETSQIDLVEHASKN
ncbi:hypothetical protein G6F57_001376 [Rhizopus arrhizus]|uniref:Uncharacterized protein n=1 Tax=Rhizopus oryzae TaxID=64495 RepID=A0A9P7BXH4_RHIOR|nr:hypothetical protein G6F23_009594 [Rhizopus arrhizus]KAG1401492.1 hypothetical protein G6F58_010736 [Rhizopus delemar]KAG0758686.1 hypothetical protein G6F24_009621 [Rhizopus arrhizus]KAG0777455.1 hypothetical protein G6F22_011863 [Rhizopus arrhizus]KAG0797241.1 hypothetical protein G6F21_000686 [Rhizopus arrhizus]